MTEVEKWAEKRGGRTVLAVTAAANIALSSAEVLETCQMAQKNQLLLGEVVRPPSDVWLELYRNQVVIMRGVLTAFLPAMLPTSGDSIDNKPLEDLKDAGTNESLDLVRFIEGISSAEIFGGATLNGFSDPPENVEEILSTPEILFFFRVGMPCWFSYGQAHCELYREAVSGCQESVLKLLNLDPWIQEDKQIRQTIITMQRDAKYAKKVSKAMQGAMDRQLKSSQVKILLASLIDRYSEALESEQNTTETQIPGLIRSSGRFEEPDIRALFDAVARDKGLEMDEDLPESPEAFYKAIYRARDFWGEGVPHFF